MAKIRTFEVDRWSEPDEKHRVKHIGMADARETFDKLKTHLETGFSRMNTFRSPASMRGLPANCLNLMTPFASRILAAARVSTWIFPWPAGTERANGIFNLLPQARRWAKRQTIIFGCSASPPSVP